jgi:PilZ domain
MVEELWKKKLEQAASNIRERRTGHRYNFVASAEVLEPQTNSRRPCRASDLDRGGCFIDTLNPFPAGTALMLRLTNENQSFRVQAEVAYVQTGMGMGLSFTVAEAEQLRILDCWIAGLAGPLALTRTKPQSYQHPAARAELPGAQRASELEPPSILKALIRKLVEKRILSHIEGAALVDDLPR